MSIGIYCIENKINGKKYVGQSQYLETRMFAYHKDCLCLLKAIELYGIENFNIYVIEECPIEKLNELEIYYIKKLRSHVSENGYNISYGGEAPMRNRNHTEESKIKMSISRTGEKNVNYHREFSEEHKRRISETKIKNGVAKGENNSRFGTKLPNAISKYFGVTNRLCKGKYLYWMARTYAHGKRIFIGQFKNEEDAAKAYDKYIIENNLPNPLNFPED